MGSETPIEQREPGGGGGDADTSGLRSSRGRGEVGRWVIGIVLVAGALAAVLLMGREVAALVPRFGEWIEGLGALGAAVFIGGYILATVAFVPGSLLTLAAGAIFGIVRGVIYVMIGATAGAASAFLLARYLARPMVERRVREDPRFERIDLAVGRQGGKIVLLMRLSPALPFNLMNYALGVTRVRFASFLWASVGMLPGTLLYVYSGKVAGDIAAVAAGAEVAKGAGYYAVLALGLIATLALTIYITRIARRALREEAE